MKCQECRPGREVDERERVPVLTETLPPAAELFWAAHPVLPEDLRENPAIREQVAERRILFLALREMFRRVPDMETALDEALQRGQVSSQEAARLWDGLASFLEKNPDASRLVLYLPFELLSLREEASRFREAYLRSWHSLLKHRDIRADFLDGNIIEEEVSGAPPRMVHKAAHLAPFLVEKGLLSLPEIERIVAESPYPLLRENLRDALDSIGGRSDTGANRPGHQGRSAHEIAAATLQSLRSRFLHIERQYRDDRAAVPARLLPRIEWERSDRRTRAVDAAAEDLCTGLGAELLSETALEEIARVGEAPAIAVVRALKSYLTGLPRDDRREAFTRYEQSIIGIGEAGSLRVRDEVASLWAYLMALGVLAPDYPEKHGESVPSFEDMTGENVPELPEREGLHAAVERVAADARLSARIYTAFLLSGSRFKGYATRTSDLDIALLIRPGVDPKERAAIKEKVREALRDVRQLGGIVDFWLEEREENLFLRTLTPEDSTQATGEWVDGILNGTWFGERETVRALARGLVGSLVRKGGEESGWGGKRREVWLRAVERETLQYRLMHRGYARFQPPRGGVKGNPEPIDGKSAFYDSGYRRAACLLFLRRVFLPRLEHGG